ncbi:MAG TPA: MFS transporter [Thermoanaerobaculia bacterium]
MTSRDPVPPRCIFILAFAAGATVANLYYSQPLLAEIAKELRVSSSAISAVSMATQLGYALGLLLLVPLGDAFERRRLLVITTGCITAALLFVATSRSLTMLVVSSFILGATTIVPQLVVPFAAHIAPSAQRGRVVGMVMSGLLVGVILSRSVSGFAAGYFGWRTTYVAAAIAMALLAVLLRFQLPTEPSDSTLRYGELLRSLGSVLRTQPVLRRHALIGAAGFAAFSVFWTSLAFRLTDLGFGTKTVGAFGIIGASGALVAPIAGRVSDRLGARVLNGGGLVLMAVSFGIMAVSGTSLVMTALAVVLLDAGAQASNIANQTEIFALDATLRNRLNALYMVAFFVGGALGSLIAGFAWQHGHWITVCASGALLAGAGLAVVSRRGATGGAA